MKNKKNLPKLLATAVSVGITFILIDINPANASNVSFFCKTDDNHPTTYTSLLGTEKPFIIWNSSHFPKYPNLVRCKQVTGRLNKVFSNGKKPFITSGQMNNLPVICTSEVEGGNCSTLIYTLKSHQDPETVLESILAFDTNDVDAGDTLEETNCPLYISIDRQGKPISSRACSPKPQMLQNLWNFFTNFVN